MNQVKMIQLINAPYWDVMLNIYSKLYQCPYRGNNLSQTVKQFKIKQPILREQNPLSQNVSLACRLFWAENNSTKKTQEETSTFLLAA